MSIGHKEHSNKQKAMTVKNQREIISTQFKIKVLIPHYQSIKSQEENDKVIE